MGHNGSTILNMALNMCPNISGVSQLNDLLNPYDPRSIDASERTENDVFWADILEDFTPTALAELKNANHSCSREKGLLSMVFSRRSRDAVCAINERVVGNALRADEASILVDSSKNISRAIAMSECKEIDVYHIHLIRDVRGLVNSHNKRRVENGLPKRYLHPTLHWLFKNITASLLVSRFAKRRILLRYEDITLSPNESMNRLETFLDESLPLCREALQGNIVIDNETRGFGGNRVLNSHQSKFRTGELPTNGVFQSRWYWFFLGFPSSLWGYRRRVPQRV
jgi:hypothetical protein